MHNAIGRTAAALAVGVAAVLICAPIASAEDPPACAPDDQQCQDEKQRQEAAKIAGEVADNVQQGLDQANQADQRNPSGVDVGAANCTMIDGVPTIIPPQGLTLGPGPHQTGPPCYVAFGVEPHN